MRTLRLSLVGTVIVVLLGSLSLVTVAQDDEEEVFGATHVTGTTPIIRDTASGTPTFKEAGMSLYEEAQVREVEWSDPRLPSSMRLTQNLDAYFVDSDEIGVAIALVQNVRLDGPQGAWTGTAYGLLEGTEANTYPQTVLMVLEGEGAYEGLSALFRTVYEEPPAEGEPADWDGYIFEGEMTPVPEAPEPPAAE
jgi:hypothetical protein